MPTKANPLPRIPVRKHPGIYYRERRSGRRYEYVYRDSDGRQRWKTVDGGLQDAIAAQDETRRLLRGGESIRPQRSRATFRTVADEWLVARKASASLSERTLEDYRLKVNRVDPFIGKRQIAKINRDDIVWLVNELMKLHRPITAKNTLMVVGLVFGYAVKHGMVARNPVSMLERNERPRVRGEREKRILERGEIDKLIAASTPTYRPVITTAIFTGLRQMELLGLRWEEIDFEKGLIRVREQLSRSGGRVPLKTPQARRDVVLMPALAKLLREHRAASPFSADGDYVFTTGTGKPFGWSNVRGGLRAACDRARIAPKPRFHDLRHTFASLLVGHGANVVFVSRQLGHASSDITLRLYAHLFAEAEHGDRTRALLEAEFGNSVGNSEVTRGSNTVQRQRKAAVVDLASLQEKRRSM